MKNLTMENESSSSPTLVEQKVLNNKKSGLMKSELPDVTQAQKSNFLIPLDWVGMGEVEALVQVNVQGIIRTLPAKTNVFVNLKDPNAKGIHMSRVYLLSTKNLEKNILSPVQLKNLLTEMITSQEGVSSKAKIQLKFELPLERKALVSDSVGLRHYPILLDFKVNELGELEQILELEVMYSSTCPCSAALARQLIKNKWLKDFDSKSSVSIEDVAIWLEKEQSIVATPHAQRSRATVRIKLNSENEFNFVGFIDLLEQTIKTPVQTAVKREDEQEFARLNGSHLMFCEDAAREIFTSLNTQPDIKDFWVKVEHLESLHSHNAVSEVSKFRNKI